MTVLFPLHLSHNIIVCILNIQDKISFSNKIVKVGEITWQSRAFVDLVEDWKLCHNHMAAHIQLEFKIQGTLNALRGL